MTHLCLDDADQDAPDVLKRLPALNGPEETLANEVLKDANMEDHACGEYSRKVQRFLQNGAVIALIDQMDSPQVSKSNDHKG